MLHLAEKSQCSFPGAVELATAAWTRLTENIWPANCAFVWMCLNLKMHVCNESHLVSLVPICCRDSSLSSSVCMGRMFFSSSSRLDGRLLNLMARESFLSTFWARVPKSKATQSSIKEAACMLHMSRASFTKITFFFILLYFPTGNCSP